LKIRNKVKPKLVIDDLMQKVMYASPLVKLLDFKPCANIGVSFMLLFVLLSRTMVFPNVSLDNIYNSCSPR